MKKKIKDLTQEERELICKCMESCCYCPLALLIEGIAYCNEDDIDGEIEEIRNEAEYKIAEIKKAEEQWLRKEIEIKVEE